MKTTFDLPQHLAAKADPALISTDERHFAAIEASLDNDIRALTTRLDELRKVRGQLGQEAMERDFEIHRIIARLTALRRFGVDVCLGHFIRSGSEEPIYVGRVGLLDDAGNSLLVDWRSPVAEPFFAATHAHPMSVDRRRRYHWTFGKITDFWDEVFTLEGVENAAALDDQSAFIASLGGDRSSKMRDVLGTIAADQDAIIRAGSRGALVVDGGPGTGKTVVALHRTAYLLYSDPHLGHNRGRVLFVGPHEPYLSYVSDVLPSLGEEGVLTCTLRDLVTEGAQAIIEPNPAVAELKSSAQMVSAIEAAVKFYEQPPTETMAVTTDIALTANDWAEAFDVPDVPHNEAREQIWDSLIEILTDKYGASPTRNALHENDDVRSLVDNSWTLIDAADLVADLWSVPAYLRMCAPWLTAEQVQLLQRSDFKCWTVSDLPLLDAARRRLGDPRASSHVRRRNAVEAAERRRMDRVVDDLIAADDDEHMAAQLRQDGIRDALVDRSVLPTIEADPLAGPFAHIVVDEAQELTDAQWQMLLQRCLSGSFTIVGDRAQARNGFTESWEERLTRIGLDQIEVRSLTINYRTPEEVMVEAEPVIRAVFPDANVPTSIRSAGVPVVHGRTSDLRSILDRWTAANPAGIACVIGDPSFCSSDRITSSTPELATGLEFDLVVLVDPHQFGDGIEGAVDRYVSMTRATQHLVILTT